MRKRGFTLLEFLITLAILGVIAALVITSLASYKSAQGLDKDTDTIIELLQQARTQTLSSKNATNYGVHVTTSSVTLFAGSTYSSGASGNEVVKLLSADTIVSTTLTGGGSDVVFNRLTGETADNGTIVVSSSSSTRTRTITISKTGLIDWSR